MMAIGISVTVACVHYVTSTSYNDICEILYSIYILLSTVNFKDSKTAVVPQGFILKEKTYFLPHKTSCAFAHHDERQNQRRMKFLRIISGCPEGGEEMAHF